MWNHACPLCFSKVPRSLLLSHSEDLRCPSCQASLELSRPTRVFNAFVGILGATASGYLVYLKTESWFLPMLAAILVFGIGAAFALWLLADLVVRAKAVQAFPQSHP